MSTKEAAELIRGMIAALSDNPRQFHINVTVKAVGLEAISHGGTAAQFTAVGGGPGSSTVGGSFSVGGPQISIAQEHGNQAFSERYQTLLTSLDRIASELESSAPDRSRAFSIYRSLLNTWIPGVITSVVGNLLTRTIGL